MSDPQMQLYQQVILEHNRSPKNFGELENATHSSEGYNPLCGDRISVGLRMQDGVCSDIRFKGDGCAICKASTSMMTASVKNLPEVEIHQKISEFLKMVKGELDPDKEEHSLGKLKIFSSIWHYPMRVKCAALAWHTLRGALVKESVVSTE